MYKVKLMNEISAVGLEGFTDEYAYSKDLTDEDAILVRSASLHEYDFAANPNLKAIARAGAGVNNIPLDKASDQGIVVFNTPGANANAVKELVVCGLLLSTRKLYEGISWVKSQAANENVAKDSEKQKKNYVGPELEGKVLGVIGLGAIGIQVANVAVKLGMRVYGYDPFMKVEAAWALSKHVRQAKSNEDIYKRCDFITVHVPSTAETKGLLNRDAFALMKDGVRILNFARPDLVNNQDLVASLDRGKVAKYITDFAVPELIANERVITFPHLGASTPEAEDNCAIMAVREVRDYLEDGNITNSVNFPTTNLPRDCKNRICIINQNVKNVLASISASCTKYNVNIENMVNHSRGDIAYTLVDTNDDLPAELIEEIKQANGIKRIRVISD